MRQAAAITLVGLLAFSPAQLPAAPALGTVQGTVTLAGRPVTGVEVAFIDLQSGAVFRATSGKAGAFEAKVAPGQYAVATENRAGLIVNKAPAYVPVVAGRVASTQIDLLALPAAVLQDVPAPAPPPMTPGPESVPAAPAPDLAAPDAQTTPPGEPPASTLPTTGAAINFDAVTCFVAGEFPLLDAAIEPIANVARGRTYFRAAQGSSFYYVEMTQEQGRFFGKLPRPRIEASPITYYLQATTTEFEESQTREIEAVVVQDKLECGDRKIAAFGPPGAVTVFSASTGVSILAPAGFAAAAASGLAVGAVTVIAGGAAAAGIVGGITGGPGGGTTATPPPINPSPIPVPTPVPQPTATPVTTSR